MTDSYQLVPKLPGQPQVIAIPKGTEGSGGSGDVIINFTNYVIFSESDPLPMRARTLTKCVYSFRENGGFGSDMTFDVKVNNATVTTLTIPEADLRGSFDVDIELADDDLFSIQVNDDYFAWGMVFVFRDS